jgi:hypothetical protein
VALTNAYCTVAELADELEMNAAETAQKTGKLERAINSAARMIDKHTGRRFWQDATVVDRQFFADDSRCCYVDDISTLTGLIVKVDDDADGTFETTLTITTDYLALPLNAADMNPVHPFTEIRNVSQGLTGFPVWSNGRPGVQVTAKFGWPAVPDDVNKACLVQAAQLFKASDAVFGGVAIGLDGGVLRLRSSLNPVAEALLEGYCLPRVA